MITSIFQVFALTFSLLLGTALADTKDFADEWVNYQLGEFRQLPKCQLRYFEERRYRFFPSAQKDGTLTGVYSRIIHGRLVSGKIDECKPENMKNAKAAYISMGTWDLDSNTVRGGEVNVSGKFRDCTGDAWCQDKKSFDPKFTAQLQLGADGILIDSLTNPDGTKSEIRFKKLVLAKKEANTIVNNFLRNFEIVRESRANEFMKNHVSSFSLRVWGEDAWRTVINNYSTLLKSVSSQQIVEAYIFPASPQNNIPKPFLLALLEVRTQQGQQRLSTVELLQEDEGWKLAGLYF